MVRERTNGSSHADPLSHAALGGPRLGTAGPPPGRTPQPEDTSPRRRLAAPIYRRFFHLCAGSAFPVLLLFLPRAPVLGAAIALLALSLAGEALRLRFERLNRFFIQWLRPLLKGKESRGITGHTYLLAATVFVVAVFPLPVAILGLFFTSIGDPLAALVGERFGAHRLPSGRSLEGSAAFLAGALAIGGLLLATGLDASLGVMVVGALAATATEVVPLGPIDDNVKIPLGSGAFMVLARIPFG